MTYIAKELKNGDRILLRYGRYLNKITIGNASAKWEAGKVQSFDGNIVVFENLCKAILTHSLIIASQERLI